MKHIEAMELALEAAYLAGFNASGEGYNGEYGIDCPEENAIWKKDRDNELKAIKQAIAAPAGHRDGHWCVDLTCKKCYSADFRLKHTTPPAAQPAKQFPPCNQNCEQGDTCPARK